MRIQIASDLHLECYDAVPQGPEFFETLVKPVSGVDLLILAGDIGYPEAKITDTFLEWCCSQWPQVVWIFGNHEYYNKPGKRITMDMKEECGAAVAARYKNLRLVRDETLDLGENLVIAGSTFWTNLARAERAIVKEGMNDCSTIWTSAEEKFTPELWNELHWASRAFLEDVLEAAVDSGKRVIVVTHHLPSYRMILPQYEGHPANCGFAARADSLVDHPCVAAWICGHSHGQRSVGRCHLNARGYPGEASQSTYRADFVIEC
jgi:hypothetical protein